MLSLLFQIFEVLHAILVHVLQVFFAFCFMMTVNVATFHNFESGKIKIETVPPVYNLKQEQRAEHLDQS